MLVTFSTASYANITLFGEVALDLLKMMGHSATVPGAILAADVPAALGRLTAAINAGNAPPPVEDKEVGKEVDENTDEDAVSMAHRARPLINLLAAAAREGKNVMWAESSILD